MRTLKKELILVNIAATGAALLIVFVLLFSSELQTWKKALVRDISIKADIIGSQCTAALTFNAARDAEDILRSLQADVQIAHAAVYDADGRMFAAYVDGDGEAQVPKIPPTDGHSFTTEHLDLTRPIMLHNERIGTITIRAHLDQLRTLLFHFGIGSTLVLLLALTGSSIMLSRLLRTVTKPITDLASLMETVSRNRDYAQRASGRGQKELASLAGSFNDMLTAIQSRDHELERSLAELKKAYGKLEDLDRLKSDFISTVSHELRTPITSIKAFVELLLIKKDMKDERKTRLLKTINSESDRLARLIGDLLDLSRIESGVMLWRDQDTAIEDVVSVAVVGILPLARGREIQIDEKVEDELPLLQVDRDRVIQVVTNLLSNAVKFTQPGGKVTITTCRTAAPAGIAVSVADTGPGIPSPDLNLIFERFHRSGDVLTSTIEGTGLGLAISREIVEHYGGRIWAESEVGKGSVFTFTIPQKLSSAIDGTPLPPRRE